MKINELSTNLNLIIDILDKIFAKSNFYKILSSEYDDINEQLDIKVYYEFHDYLEAGHYSDMYIVGIPDYILDAKVLNTDIKNFIELMTENIEDEMNKIY